MNPRKKILVFTTSYLPFIGGAEIAVREVARRLCNSFDLYIITARHKRGLARRENVAEGTIIRVGFGTSFDKWLLPVFGFCAVIRLAVFGEIPKPWKQSSRESLLLWGMDISQGSVAARATKTFFPKISFIFTVQYGDGDARLVEGRRGSIAAAFRYMLAGADAVTAISSYLLDVTVRHGFAGTARIIPNGVDTSVFGLRPQRTDEEAERNQPVIITTSRLVEKNGVDTLIRAIKELKKYVPSIKCYIIGDGPERHALEKLASDLQMTCDIIFLGIVPYEEIPFYLSKADVFVRVSRTEGMGNSFVEALSVGVPVIGTPVGGIPDIIRDHETGLFCRVDDAHDLAEKVLMLLRDGDLVERLRKEGRRLVEEKFSWDSIARSYKTLFVQLAEARTRILIATPLYPPEIGGPATYSRILSEHLLEAGVGVRMLRFSEVRTLPKALRHLAYFLKTLARARQCDCVLALDPVSVGFPASLAALILRKHFIIKIVGDYAWEQGMQRFGVTEFLDDFLKKSYGFRVELLRKVQFFTARRAQGIIVPSLYLKKVVATWGIDEKKIVVIANAEEIEVVSQSRKDLREDFGFSGTILVSAGRLVPWKGFDLLIDSMPELIRSDPHTVLLIAGSGPQKEELESMIAAKGLNDYMKLLGAVPHHKLLMYIKAADVFVLATAYEGLSHTILEAMAMGAMIVASNVGGNPELVEHNKNGFLFDRADTGVMTRMIREAIALPEKKRIEISNAAVNTATRYAPERMIELTARYLLNL